MFHRLWTLIRKELQSLLREPQTRAILILPVLIQVILFPFAATLEVTNATISCAAAEKPTGDPPNHRHTKGVTPGAFPG